jgi:hypothetical protein
MNITTQQKYIIGGVILVGLIGYAWWSHKQATALVATPTPSPLPAGTTPPAGTVPGAGGAVPGAAPPGTVPGGAPTTPIGTPANVPAAPPTFTRTMTYAAPMAMSPPPGSGQTVVNGRLYWTR